MALFQAKNYEIIATKFAPKLSWPDKIHDIAKFLAEDNPKFDYIYFVSKATLAWEEQNNKEPELDDEIPQLKIS